MIYIGLDVSKVSTALCIEDNNNLKLFNYTTTKSNNIWIKETEHLINYRFVNYDYPNIKNYSEKELRKLTEFDEATSFIVNDIFDNLNILESAKIAIEGYSYNSKGPIFDLIEFTTLLKIKLLNRLNNYSEIKIISPLTLKTETCKMVYEPRIEIKGKKIKKEIIHYENEKGKNATKFDKWDMFHAFIDSGVSSNLKEWCKSNRELLEKNKELPKPLDDLIDSVWLVQTIKNGI